MERQPQDKKEAFSAIVERYSDFVYSVALRMTGNPHDAEDVTQETFLSAYKNFDRFRGDAQVSTWLYRIAMNAALMRIRKDKKTTLLVEYGVEDDKLADWAPSPESAALTGELRQRLQDGLARLPPDMRAAVVLRDVQGLSGEEAAKVLNIPVATLKTRLHRGRVLLRAYLQDYLTTSKAPAKG